MKKFICVSPMGLKFSDKGKDFELKNGQKFDSDHTEYMSYLIKAKYIKEVVVMAIEEPEALPVAVLPVEKEIKKTNKKDKNK